MLGLHTYIATRQVQITDPFGESVFPSLVELLKSSENQKVLRHVGFRKGKKYRDIVDALLCEAFPDFLDPCLLFYNGGGPKLSEMKTTQELIELEQMLLKVIKIAEQFQSEQKITWISFRLKASQKPNL
ncbi:MAG: hypothetical protein JWM20_951 [Patescibacteria group bacterium]|nr:hypothetical protein [Patescibacteria group bacterium]